MKGGCSSITPVSNAFFFNKNELFGWFFGLIGTNATKIILHQKQGSGITNMNTSVTKSHVLQGGVNCHLFLEFETCYREQVRAYSNQIK